MLKSSARRTRTRETTEPCDVILSALDPPETMHRPPSLRPAGRADPCRAWRTWLARLAIALGLLATAGTAGSFDVDLMLRAAQAHGPHALAGSVWQLLVLRTAVGLAQGGASPMIEALLIEMTPPGRRGEGRQVPPGSLLPVERDRTAHARVA